MISNLPTLLGQQDFHAEHSDMLAAARDGRTVDPKAREVSLVSGQGQAVIATDGPVVRPPPGETFDRVQAQEERRRQISRLRKKEEDAVEANRLLYTRPQLRGIVDPKAPLQAQESSWARHIREAMIEREAKARLEFEALRMAGLSARDTGIATAAD